MLGDIFYFFGLILFILNLSTLLNFQNYNRIYDWYYKFKKVTKKEPTRSDFKSKDFEYFSFYLALEILNICWVLLGLVTKSWLIFIAIFIFNILMNSILKKLHNYFVVVRFLRLFKVTIVTMIFGFLFLNHFHLHKDPLTLLSFFFR